MTTILIAPLHAGEDVPVARRHQFFGMMVLIWFLAWFPQVPSGTAEPAVNFSLAAMIGHALQLALAYAASLLTYNVASALGAG